MSTPADNTRLKLKINPYYIITDVTKKKERGDEYEIEDVYSEAKKKSYEYRKYQKISKTDKEHEKALAVSNHGIEFDGSDENIKTMFGKLINSEDGEEQFINYIYVISKKVDNRTFIKVGVSEKYSEKDPLSRIRQGQTFLLPGLENIGFKIHYIYKYVQAKNKYNQKPHVMIVEGKLHELIRAKYSSYVMNFMSGVVSEWYLPDESYFVLFNFIRGVICAQKEMPSMIYECKNNRITELEVKMVHPRYKDYKLPDKPSRYHIYVMHKQKLLHYCFHYLHLD